MVEFEPTSTGLDMKMAYNFGDIDYSGYFLAQEMLFNAGNGQRRYGSILGLKSNENWNLTGLASMGEIPLIGLSVVPIRVKDETLTIEHKMEVFPNPARDVATLSVDLPQVASAIVVQTLDNNGRLLQEEVFKNVQKQDLPLNISELASGSYMLRVLTPEGTRMKKLSIVR
jgi:Secretion system C-terminal sorting domain